MGIQSLADGSLMTLYPDGVVDSQQGDELGVAIDEAIEVGKDRFIINLQRVRSANSAGLECLVRSARAVNSAGHRIALVGACAAMSDILHATRLDLRFATFESTEQAMKSMRRGI